MSIQSIAHRNFVEAFKFEPSHHFHAPGRVNLIGEHTDYNDGFVLPAAINFGTFVCAKKREDNLIRACAVNFNKEITEFSLTGDIPACTTHRWSNYLRGVCQVLMQTGYELTGADITIAGDVPYGAGLSSSAALEIVLIRALLELANIEIDPKKAALLGQQVENEYIGANTGIMDQLVCALGQKNQALLIDCRSLESQPVALDSDMAIVIINSNVKRGLVDSEYNLRRAQCNEAAQALNVSHLRDATFSQLENAKTHMSQQVYQRARHIISENERTLNAASALKDKNWSRLSELMAQSHASMRDDFEITVPAIDAIVEMVADVIGDRGGVRMTGGGFGGCVVALAPTDLVSDIRQTVMKQYQATFGIKEDIYICTAEDGAFMA
ncbi:galactokinase [Reinekea marina]|uniref:Galactokinase n=1 Tax=Reinekea marina TaxID=1310421 RepID=A0ABV7WS82_9GAMM|nr:galactokinase [Reinekea marina]MDN3649105.1 galactokinase [Reinekea marina]